MKRLLHIPVLIVLALLAFTSCQQKEEEGLLKLGLELATDDLEKGTAEDYANISGALVTITDMDGMPELDKEFIEVIRFGSSFVTQSLKLKVGEYLLDEFMLLDATGQAVWATPRAGSNLASLVQEPLPRYFNINPDITTSLDLQVVSVADHNPGDFGYAEFHIDFVDRFCLKVYYNGLDPYLDNDTTPYYDAAGVPWYEPRITIVMGNLVLDENMHAGINHFNLPIRDTYYAITASNYFGQTIFERKFTLDELRVYSCEADSPALMISDGSNPDVVITEEGLREPTINQGVFGQFMPAYDPNGTPLPVLDSLPEDDPESLVHELYIFPGYLLDSLMYMSPMNCIIPPEWIPDDPVAVVRSNSEGFFQLPLEAGDYTYMVLSEQGFYVDMYLSSRRGGYLMIHPMEVTELYISIADCSMWM